MDSNLYKSCGASPKKLIYNYIKLNYCGHIKQMTIAEI